MTTLPDNLRPLVEVMAREIENIRASIMGLQAIVPSHIATGCATNIIFAALTAGWTITPPKTMENDG